MFKRKIIVDILKGVIFYATAVLLVFCEEWGCVNVPLPPLYFFLPLTPESHFVLPRFTFSEKVERCQKLPGSLPQSPFVRQALK